MKEKDEGERRKIVPGSVMVFLLHAMFVVQRTCVELPCSSDVRALPCAAF